MFLSGIKGVKATDLVPANPESLDTDGEEESDSTTWLQGLSQPEDVNGVRTQIN